MTFCIRGSEGEDCCFNWFLDRCVTRVCISCSVDRTKVKVIIKGFLRFGISYCVRVDPPKSISLALILLVSVMPATLAAPYPSKVVAEGGSMAGAVLLLYHFFTPLHETCSTCKADSLRILVFCRLSFFCGFVICYPSTNLARWGNAGEEGSKICYVIALAGLHFDMAVLYEGDVMVGIMKTDKII